MHTQKNNVIFFCLTLALSLFCFFYNLDNEKLFFGDESLHSSVVKEMYITGDWQHPTFRDHAYLSKPPLKLWFSLLLTKVFEPSVFWMRFPDALFATFSSITIFILTVKLFNSALSGFLAVFFLLSSQIFLFRHCARMAVQDSTLFLCTCISMLFFWQLFKKQKYSQFSSEAFFIGISTAVAVMVKYVAGLQSLICGGLFLLVNTPINVFAKRWFKPFSYISIITVCPIFLWLAFICINYFQDFYEVFLIEIYERLVGTGIHHTNDRLFYLYSLFVQESLFPKVLIYALTFFWIYKIYKKNTIWIYLFIWGWFPIILFSLLNSKLIWYMLPSFPALVIAGGQFIVELINFIFKKQQLLNTKSWINTITTTTIKISCSVLLCCIIYGSYQKFSAVVTRLQSPKSSYQIEAIVKAIKNNNLKVALYNHNGESILHKTPMPDFNRFFLLDILNQTTFLPEEATLDLEKINDKDIIIFPACYYNNYTTQLKMDKCAYFDSTPDKGNRNENNKRYIPKNGYIAACQKNCPNASFFVDCSNFAKLASKQNCHELNSARKKMAEGLTATKYAKNPSFYAPLRDYLKTGN